MKKPELMVSDGGIQYSDWVIGEYDNTSICPFRIVRMGLKEGRYFWEFPDLLGPEEDLWPIGEPDIWHSLVVKRG